MSCNCDVWCPCVLSLGKADPTCGRCLSWWGIHCEDGRYGDVSLNGITPVMATNTNYWAGIDVVVSKATKSRIRDWGRNWDFSGQSAEYASVDWVNG